MKQVFEINSYGGLFYLESEGGQVTYSVHQDIESAVKAFRKQQKYFNYEIVLNRQGKRYI